MKFIYFSNCTIGTSSFSFFICFFSLFSLFFFLGSNRFICFSIFIFLFILILSLLRLFICSFLLCLQFGHWVWFRSTWYISWWLLFFNGNIWKRFITLIFLRSIIRAAYFFFFFDGIFWFFFIRSIVNFGICWFFILVAVDSFLA